MEKSFYPGPARWVWVAFFVVITSALLAGAYTYYRSETERIRQQKYQEIASIGELKVGQIRQWRQERLGDITKASKSPFLGQALREWLRDRTNTALRVRLQDRFFVEQKEKGYADVLILDTEYRVLLSAEPSPHPLNPAGMRVIEKTLADRTPMLSDLYRCPQGIIHVDAVAPILGAGGQPLAVLVFRSNAESLLYPLIQSWPTPSQTAETLLVRKEGENVLFLNDLRHRPNAALSLQEPLTLTDFPAAQAVLGKQGMFHGRDYRGVEVMADLRHIPDSPWFMVAKVDAFEILDEARYRGVVAALFAGLFILLAAGVTAYGYRHRQARLYHKLYRSKREQREAQEQFRTTLYSIGEAVITTDTAGLVKQMNPVAERLTGWLEAEAREKRLDEVFHIVNEDSREEVENPVKRVLREGQVVGLANHTLLVAKDGAERPIADSGAPIRDETGAITGVVLVFRDQTQERMAQQAVKESEERLALAMEATNEGVWDWNMATNEVFRSPSFFSMLGYEAADFSGRFGEWHNLVHPEDLRLVRNTLDDYLAGKRKTFETEFRMVNKSGDYVWILSRGKIVARDEAGTPLRMIGTHTNVTERKRSEEALRESQERNRFLAIVIEASSQPFAVGYPDGSIGTFNRAYCNLVGYSEDEMSHTDWDRDLTPPEYHELESCKLVELVQTGEPVRYEKEYIRKDGSRVPVELLVHVTRDESNQPLHYYAFVTDLTDRKLAEEALKESEARVRMKLDAILSPEGDIGTLDLADVMDAPAIQALMDNFFSLTKIPVGIIDLGGKILVATGWQDICTKFHRVHPETHRHCVESDTLLSGGLEQGSFKLYRCKNNMWDIATPIIVGGKHLGNLFLGQFLFEDESPDYEAFRSQASQYGFDEQQYLAALERVPRWSRETVDTVMTFYARLANMLSTLSYSSIELARSLAEQERLVHALRQSEERYRSLFENMLDGFAYCKMYFEDGKPQDFIYLDVNGAFERLTGLKNVIGKKVTEVIPGIKESNPELFEIYGRVAITGNPERFETYLDSLGIWLSTSVYSTEREYFAAVFDNITDRKQAEAALRSLSDFRQTLIDSIPNPVFYKDVEGKYIGCNEAFAALVGFPKEDVVGRSVFEVVPKDLADLWREKDRELFDGPHVQVFECTLARPDGTERSLVFHKAPIFDADGALAGLIGVVMDITDRLRAEEALRQSEEWYRALVENSFDGIFIQRGPKIIFANSHLYEMLGYSQGELEGLDHWVIYHPEYQEISRERAVARMRGEDLVAQYEVKLQRRDGSTFDGELSARAVKVKGEPGVQVWVKDVSKRKRTEEAQRRLATAVEQSAEAIVVSDTTGNIQWVNPAFERITGYTREEVIGQNSSILKSGEHDEIFYRNLWEMIKRGQVWKGRFINKRKDGSLYHEDSTISPVLDSRGKIINFVAVKRDITEQLALSRQLLQAQKMEAIGTLAGGIAHDFNNLLQVTLGYSELLLAEKSEEDSEYADLSKIFQAAKSGAELVQRLLTFSRKVEPRPIPLDLNRQIRQVKKLLGRTIPKMIDIQMDLSDDLPEISGESTQMEQVLMNLAVNARDAMPDGGKLTLGTKNVTLDEEYCGVHTEAKPGEYVLLTVSDTGHGMYKETIDHIFEPFYTTKELGRGTGLGLAMVYGIVKQHGGYITCYSEVEHGTTFNVYFPALESEVEPDIENTSVMPAFGTETVLLVDDEELVRDLGARILSKAGYQVLTATNGKEALDLFEKEKGQLSLVILDLIMPVMGGKECIKELLKIDPRAKVLIASGFSADASTKESVGMRVRGFVSKPFRMKELLRQVRKVLDES